MEFSKEELTEARRQIGSTIHKLRETVKTLEGKERPERYKAQITLAVGVTFAFLEVSIVPAASVIGVTTFCLSLVGVAVGNFFGARYKRRAELSGGVILILLGIKILLEHLGIF